MKKHRLYSLPYNGESPNWYIEEVLKRKDFIDHVFCELPYMEMISHVRFLFNKIENNNIKDDSFSSNFNRAKYISNCIDFLRLSKGLFRRFCPINAMYYIFESENQFDEFVSDVINIVDEFEIDGLILSEYRLALKIHMLRPNLEIHTSCNSYQWNLRQMKLWKDNIGVTYFNPPREILRNYSKLKEMHDAGFKLKCIVNESCLYGCPNSFSHQMSISLNAFCFASCLQKDYADLFKSNWILPRWQKHYDKYVDIYKIAGRNVPGNYPFFVLDAFIHERDDICLLDLLISGTSAFYKMTLQDNVLKKITLDKVPDKLVFCECKDCEKCKLCNKILSSIILPENCNLINMSISKFK